MYRVGHEEEKEEEVVTKVAEEEEEETQSRIQNEGWDVCAGPGTEDKAILIK